MKASYIVSAVFFALAAASPLEEQPQSELEERTVTLPASVEITLVRSDKYHKKSNYTYYALLNMLNFSPFSVTELAIVPGSTPTYFDAGDIECRMYQPETNFALNGTRPGSPPFTLKNPARLGDVAKPIGSILCYAVKSRKTCCF